MKVTVIREIATLVNAIHSCRKSGNKEWEINHSKRLAEICQDRLPIGSGFDNGSEVMLEESRDNRITISTSFHHMDENGSYDGWTEHDVIVTPDFISGLVLRVTGPDRRDIKEHIADTFREALSTEIET